MNKILARARVARRATPRKTTMETDQNQEQKPRVFAVIETIDRSLGSITLFTSREEAINWMNEQMRDFIKQENMHDILEEHDEEWAETGVQPDEGWIHFAEMSDEEPDAWCSSHDLDMYVREITTEIDRIGHVKP